MDDTTEHRAHQWAQAVLATGVLFLLCGGVLFYLRDYCWDVLTGPVAVKSADVAAVSDPASLPRRYVTLTVLAYADTDIRKTKKARGSKVSTTVCDYVLVKVEDRWMIASVPPGFRGPQLTGYLEVWKQPTYNADALPMIYKSLKAEVGERMLPFQINASQNHDFFASIAFYSTVGFGLLTLFFGAFWLAALRKLRQEQSAFATTQAASLPAGMEWRWGQ